MSFRFIPTVGVALFLLFSPMTVQAQDDGDAIGTILEVEGTATRQTATGTAPATVNMPVHAGDTLSTGTGSRLYVLLIDNTEFTLSENSRMTVEDYSFDDQDTTGNHAVYSILQGAFLYVSGLVAKKENPDITINIPQGSIGIRGTRLWGGDLDGDYNILVGEGEIDIDTTGDGKPLRLKKNEGTTLRGRGIRPAAAKIWAKERIARAVGTVALKNPKIIGQRMKAEQEKHQPALRRKHRELQKRRLEKDSNTRRIGNMESVRARPMTTSTESKPMRPTDKAATIPSLKKDDTTNAINQISPPVKIAPTKSPQEIKAREVKKEIKEQAEKKAEKTVEPENKKTDKAINKTDQRNESALQKQRLMQLLKQRGLQ